MILGVVLAGGRSSRFGTDKAAALLSGRPLAAHAAVLLAPYVARVVVAGHDGAIPDRPRAGLGPLGGIAGALDYAAHQDYTSVMTIACDMPHLPDGLLDALARAPTSYCPDAPVLGHWHTALAAGLLAHIESSSDHAVRRWAETVGATPIPAPHPIPNINTPGDLDAL